MKNKFCRECLGGIKSSLKSRFFSFEESQNAQFDLNLLKHSKKIYGTCIEKYHNWYIVSDNGNWVIYILSN